MVRLPSPSRYHSCYQSSSVQLIDWLIDYVTIQSSQVVPSDFGRRFNLVSSNWLVNFLKHSGDTHWIWDVEFFVQYKEREVCLKGGIEYSQMILDNEVRFLDRCKMMAVEISNPLADIVHVRANHHATTYIAWFPSRHPHHMTFLLPAYPSLSAAPTDSPALNLVSVYIRNN